MEKIRDTDKSFKQQRQETNRNSVLNNNAYSIDHSVPGPVENTREIRSYYYALKDYKNKMSTMVKNIIKTVETSREEYMENPIRVKTSGKQSKIDYETPLFVETPIIHDVSHVVNDKFRDHLCRNLPGNKRKLFDSPELEKHLLLIENIRRAEKDVMEVQERLLKATSDSEGHQMIELEPRNIEYYSLLNPPAGGNNGKDRKEQALNDNADEKTVCGENGGLRRLRLRLNKERPKLGVKYCKPKTPRKYFTAENPENTCLKVNTDIILFGHYKPGGVYKKTLLITNSGKRLASFRIKSHGASNGNFDYHCAPGRPLASGMTAKLTVTFKCTSMEDVYELIDIITPGNRIINVHVYAENPMPILKYIAEHYDMDTTAVNSTRQGTPPVCVFECNACLVGATKTIAVEVKMKRRSAKFVCVPEDVWYTELIEDIEWSGTMRLGAFEIAPSIFKIDRGDTITIYVTFKPLSPSFYCSRFIIVSDNSCAHEVNVFGDGQSYGSGKVRLKGRDLKQSAASVTGAEASYLLDMGKIGQVVRYVYAKNTSRIKYPYHWIINHEIAKPGLKNAQVNFNVHPSTGFLDKNSKTMFRLECGVTDEIVNEQLTGEYRVTATMMIDDVPKMSIIDQGISFEEHEDSSELVSVRTAAIVVTCEYEGKERISLSVDPSIVDLRQYGLMADGRANVTVCFVNGGTRPVRARWIRPDDDEDDDDGDHPKCTRVRVVPERFVVTAGRAEANVLVGPAVRPGRRLRAALQFRLANDDGRTGRTVVYVRGAAGPSPREAVRVRPVVAPPSGPVRAGDRASYRVRFAATSGAPVRVRRTRLYAFRAVSDTLTGPYGNATAADFEAPIATHTTGISCQLTEWSLVGSETVVYTQAVTSVRLPDLRLNVNAVTVTESLYRGVSHSFRGIRLLNNTHNNFVYSWGNPMGLHANSADCAFKPANGTVCAGSFVEFEFIVTPKISGYLNKYYVLCFVQCDALAPLQISLECRVDEFSATVAYVDVFDRTNNITWRHNENQWTTDNNFEEIYQIKSECLKTEENSPNSVTTSLDSFDTTENIKDHETGPETQQESANWRFVKYPKLDTPLWTPVFKLETSNSLHSAMAFKDIECNKAMEQYITIRNTTKIPCRVKSKICYYDYNTTSNTIERASEEKSKKYCSIWIERDDEVLYGHDEFKVSVWVLATVWGRYEDVVTIELHVGEEILPAVHIPLIVQAITFPIEFPFATHVHTPTVKFSLYSMNSEQRLQILNNSEIPIQVSWNTYSDSKNKKPFAVILDTLTSDIPNIWLLRIGRYYGSEMPRYFMIRPRVLNLGPKELGFVTFSLDRTSEISINRDKNNMVYGTAVGTVTALEPPGKYCIRNDGQSKLRPIVVKLSSETRHSIRPKLVLRNPDNIFQISATRIFNSQLPFHTINRSFTLLNLLRYPATISFTVDSPFVIQNLKTLRCGTCTGYASIPVFYEDMIEIELQANIVAKTISIPKMPTELSCRKLVQIGNLWANCENNYFDFKMVASFELHIYFPVLKLSTSYINFDQVVVRETKSIDVMLSSYPGPERFTAYSDIDEVFNISPTEGVVSHTSPVCLTITFKPKAAVQYSNKIAILTTLPMDRLFLQVFGTGIEHVDDRNTAVEDVKDFIDRQCDNPLTSEEEMDLSVKENHHIFTVAVFHR